MNKASKVYSTKSGALQAMRRKADIIHAGGRSGSVPFARLFVEDNILHVQSNYWTQSTLEDFLNGRKKTLTHDSH